MSNNGNSIETKKRWYFNRIHFSKYFETRKQSRLDFCRHMYICKFLHLDDNESDKVQQQNHTVLTFLILCFKNEINDSKLPSPFKLHV